MADITTKSQLKETIRGIIKEILQEDDLISKIILESYNAAKIISSQENNQKNKIIESNDNLKINNNNNNNISNISEFEKWKKIIKHKPKDLPDASYLFEEKEKLTPIESIMNRSQNEKNKEISSFEDLLNEPLISSTDTITVEPDLAIMNALSKKFKNKV